MATSTVAVKESAVLIRCPNKSPLLAKLHTQEQVFHIVEVSVRGGHKYALGVKRTAGYCWVINPTDKTTLWKTIKERWNVSIAN